MVKKKKILVIEDEYPLLELIKTKLEKAGFEVVGAREAKEALEKLEKSKEVAAIWLDHYLLGKESGFDFLLKVKNDSSKRNWKEIPIFVVSNTAGYDKLNAYLGLGASKYYIKTEHRLDEVVEEIKSFLGVSKNDLNNLAK